MSYIPPTGPSGVWTKVGSGTVTLQADPGGQTVVLSTSFADATPHFYIFEVRSRGSVWNSYAVFASEHAQPAKVA